MKNSIKFAKKFFYTFCFVKGFVYCFFDSVQYARLISSDIGVNAVLHFFLLLLNSMAYIVGFCAWKKNINKE